jgi:hypothetical protein
MWASEEYRQKMAPMSGTDLNQFILGLLGKCPKKDATNGSTATLDN